MKPLKPTSMNASNVGSTSDPGGMKPSAVSIGGMNGWKNDRKECREGKIDATRELLPKGH